MEDLLGRENVNFSLVTPEEQDERAKKFKEQRMTRGFDDSETHCTKDDWEFEQDLNTRNEKKAKVDKALKHFSKYFHDLWW